MKRKDRVRVCAANQNGRVEWVEPIRINHVDNPRSFALRPSMYKPPAFSFWGPFRNSRLALAVKNSRCFQTNISSKLINKFSREILIFSPATWNGKPRQWFPACVTLGILRCRYLVRLHLPRHSSRNSVSFFFLKLNLIDFHFDLSFDRLIRSICCCFDFGSECAIRSWQKYNKFWVYLLGVIIIVGL